MSVAVVVVPGVDAEPVVRELRDCRARVAVSCEQLTLDPRALCGACADQLEGFLGTADDDAPF